MNRYVDAIECRTQTIRLFRGATIPILSRNNQRNTNTKYENEQLRNETTERTQRDNDAPFNCPHTVRLAKHVTIPPLSQMSIPALRRRPDSISRTEATLANATPLTNVERSYRSTIRINNRYRISELLENDAAPAKGHEDSSRDT